MKNLKIRLPFLALLLGLGIVFIQSAFTADKAKRVDAFGRYDLTDDSGIRDGNHYRLITAPQELECPEGADIPCYLNVQPTIDTRAELTTYLTNMVTFPSDADITASAPQKKLGD